MKRLSIKIGIYFSLILAAMAIYSCSGNTDNSKQPALQNIKHTANHIVTIDGMKFVPDTVNVQKGDTVTFVNADLVQHNATQLPTAEWHSPNLNQYESWSFVPQKSDSFYCSLHLVMKGLIIVQ